MSNNEDINLNSYRSDPKNGKNPQKKKPKKANFWTKLLTWQKVLICVCLVFVIILSSVAVYIFSTLNKIQRDDDFNDLTSSDLNIVDVIDENTFNIALFGVDARTVGDFSGLSDSIMILSVNKSDNTIKLISVMRDSLVPIEHNNKTSYDKINAAYAKGDAALAVKTLNTIFGLDIAEYATVNFYGMRDIIDAVGGIDVEITKSELNVGFGGINQVLQELCEYTNEDPSKYEIKEAGFQHLNGIQAVAYSRIRYAANFNGTNNDFGRTERQRYVMQQLLDKALAMNIAEYPGLVAKLTPYVKTSLSNDELLSLAMLLSKKPQMQTLRVPGDDYIINADFRGTGSSTVYYNYEFAGKIIHAFLYDNISEADYIATNGVDKTRWYGNGSDYTNSTTTSSTSSSSSSDTSDTSSSDTSSSSSSSTDSSEESSSDSSSSSSGSSSNSTPEETPDESSSSSSSSTTEEEKEDSDG